MSTIAQPLCNEAGLPFTPLVGTGRSFTELQNYQHHQHQPVDQVILVLGDQHFTQAGQAQSGQAVAVGGQVILLDSLAQVLAPVDNTHFVEMASELVHLAAVSSLAFADSRPLSSEEHDDLEKFYRKVYKKV